MIIVGLLDCLTGHTFFQLHWMNSVLIELLSCSCMRLFRTAGSSMLRGKIFLGNFDLIILVRFLELNKHHHGKK